MAPVSLVLTRDEDTLKKQFAALQTPEDLADLLDVSYTTLRYYVYSKVSYRSFSISKSSGSKRYITAPNSNVKLIQRKLSQVLYAVYGSRASVHGFAKNRSVKSNARKHLGAKWVLNFDLKDFFPSIHFGRVMGLFAAKPYALPKGVATLIAQLACYDKKLPQGAPSSPIIANMVCARMDAQFKNLCFSAGCTYTRYADDITISTKANGFPEQIVKPVMGTARGELGDAVLQILQDNSFEAHPTKTRIRGRSSCQEITGVRINSGLNVRKGLLRQVRSILHDWEVNGEQAAEIKYRATAHRKRTKNDSPSLRAVMRGKIDFIGFVRGVDSTVHVKLRQRLAKLAPEMRFRPVIVSRQSHESVIRQAIWLLYDHDKYNQGTAFAIRGGYLLTAAHNLDHMMYASRPNYEDQSFFVEEVWRDDDFDLALGRIKAALPVQLDLAPPQKFDLTSQICVVGFPQHHMWDTVAFRFGRIVQSRTYAGIDDIVEHMIVDADIVKGNSGGPVLDANNRVVGVAVKGLGVPGKLGDGDQLSSFVPVHDSFFSGKVSPKVFEVLPLTPP